MKDWLKKQATEFTAWVGFFLCLSVFFTPDWITFIIGLLLIAIDDEKAKTWVARVSPKVGELLDEWPKP